jgi:hypothetical protein
MNNMIPKKAAQAIAADEAELAGLKRRISEMDSRAREVLEIQINLEKTSAAADNFAASSDHAAAEALLAGAKFVATRERPVSPLDAIYAEKKTLAHAIKIGNARLHILTTERAERIWAAHLPELAAIEKRRIMTAFELQRINRAREVLREKVAKAGGAGYLSTDGVELLGLGGDAEINWAAKRLIADGICTKAEIEKARADV